MSLKFLHPKGKKNDGLEDEIKSMVNKGTDTGSIDSAEAQMINNIFEFDDKEAQDIMTHRENIIGIQEDTLLSDAVSFMLDGKNSRYPVYEDNIDNITGILYFKDAMKAYFSVGDRSRPVRDIDGLIMEARFIPQTKKIDALFRTMQSKKIHMVIVVDEYGQTAGIVAMEDILEEIVGNILDEYDDDEINVRRLNENVFICNGLTPLEEAGEKMQISFPDEEYETLNGFLTDRMGHVPKPGDEFETDYGGYKFHIVSIRGHIIQTVRCTRIIQDDTEASEKNNDNTDEKEQ